MPASMPASSKGGGECLGAPNVCKLPNGVPSFFISIGRLVQAIKTAVKVKFCGKEAVTEISEVPRSQGDEAGVGGGAVSQTNMDKVVVKKGTKKVLVQGRACGHLGSMTTHNGTNPNVPAGAQISPSQTKVLVNPS